MSSVDTRRMGPNVRRLVCHGFSLLAIPSGDGFLEAVAVLKNPHKMSELMRKATVQAFEWIDCVKSAPDNPYGDDDEAIAEAILAKVEEKRQREIKRLLKLEGSHG